MRLVIGLALALALSAPAAGQPAAPAAANELLFETRARGTARSRADHAVVTLHFSATGTTAPEARRTAQALCDRLKEIARRFGAEPLASAGGVGGGLVDDQIATFPGTGEGEGAAAAPARAPFTGFGMVRLRLGDTSRFSDLRAALEQAGGLNISGPIHQLADEDGARRAARLDALANARADAEAFASSQQMRVIRMVRFTEVPESRNDALRAVMEQMGANAVPAAGAPQVETRFDADVGFVLGPR